MSKITQEQFYDYFKDLNEWYNTGALLKKNAFPDPDEKARAERRVNSLNQSLAAFRKRVYAELQEMGKFERSQGKKITLFCTNKDCKHRFDSIKYAYLRVLYQCPKCNSATIEMI